MLFFIIVSLAHVVFTDNSQDVKTVKIAKPYNFPVPFELPYRNERTEQCWLRIEDAQLVETINVYCFMAQEFLENYIHDYNSNTMTADGVDVSLWSEKARARNDIVPPDNSQHSIKDWRVTTVLDPITRMRLYVSTNADCRLVMYSREAMTNYNVNCERILYYFNVRMSAGVFSSVENVKLITLSAVFVILHSFL